MEVAATTDRAADSGADTIVVGLFEGERVAGVVEGAVLSAYRFTRYQAEPDDDDRLERLVVSASDDVGSRVEEAAVLAAAQNAARDLQNTPANDLTPTRLAERARELAGEVSGLSVEVEGRDGLAARGMGA